MGPSREMWGSSTAGRAGSAQELLFEIADDLPNVGIDFHAIFDQPTRMKNGAMIPSTKGLPNSTKGALGHLTRKEHRHLSWKSNVFRASLTGHIRQSYVKMFSDLLLNGFDADGITAFFVQDLA